MFKFFRKIRQRLLTENRFTKYLIYAIGEIVLVVIGILIALQINNWSEHKKERVKEKKILKELLVDLEISKADLENDIKVNQQILVTAEKLKSHIFQKKPNYRTLVDEMLRVADVTQFSPRTSGYENLKSEGISLITNDSLRKEISNLFEINFPRAVRQGSEFDNKYNSRIDLAPYFMKYFEIDMKNTVDLKYYNHTTNPAVVNKYQELLNDGIYFKTLQKTIFDRVGKISIYIRTVEKINNVNSLIKQELNKNSK